MAPKKTDVPGPAATAFESEDLQQQWNELQLEDLRNRVEEQRGKKLQLQMARQRMAAVLAANERNDALRREACKHRKGGKNKAGFLNGNDSNYSVIHHTYPDGRFVVMCSRCQSEWEKPPIELRRTNPQLYRQLLAEFTTVVNWPTDNEPSGTQLFLIQHDPNYEPQAVTA